MGAIIVWLSDKSLNLCIFPIKVAWILENLAVEHVADGLGVTLVHGRVKPSLLAGTVVGGVGHQVGGGVLIDGDNASSVRELVLGALDGVRRGGGDILGVLLVQTHLR